MNLEHQNLESFVFGDSEIVEPKTIPEGSLAQNSQKPQKYENVTLVNELEKTEALVEELIGEEAIGLDIETTGLDPLLDKIRLVQIATADDTYVIDLNYVPISALNPLLTSGPIKIIHNAKFDASFLYEAPGGAMPVSYTHLTLPTKA